MARQAIGEHDGDAGGQGEVFPPGQDDLAVRADGCQLVSNMLARGDPLDRTEREAEAALAVAQAAKHQPTIAIGDAQLRLIRALRGETGRFPALSSDVHDEERYEAELAASPVIPLVTCWYWLRELQARVFAGDHALAFAAAAAAEPLLWTSPANVDIGEHRFYAALARAGRHDALDEAERAANHAALASDRRQLATWAASCPENYGPRAALVEAEVARIEQRELDAQRLYERAIGLAREHGFVHIEGLGHELAGKFYAGRGLDTCARAYLRGALDCYVRWGAAGKVEHLLLAHPFLREQLRPAPPAIDSTLQQLELATAIKVSRAVSSEIVLDRLIEALMTIAIEHAGAQRGVLLLAVDGTLGVEAMATAEGRDVEVQVRRTPMTDEDVPTSIVRYVQRARQGVSLDDAALPNQFSRDPYLGRRGCRSVLCLPLIKNLQVGGVLYLENNLAPYVFTPARLAVLDLLASQAAISLENARLYGTLRRMDAYMTEGQRLSRTGTFGWKPATNELLWSDESYRITGMDPRRPPTLEEVLERVHPDDRSAVSAALRAARREDGAMDFEHRLALPDGTVRHVHVLGRAFRDAAGELEIIGALMDVTAAKRAADELEQAHARLEQMARVTTLGELAASIAHEINQPLAAIGCDASACLNWLAAEVVPHAEIRSALAAIARDAQRAGLVLTGIRALLSRRAAAHTTFSLDSVVGGVLPVVTGQLKRQGLSLETHLEAASPVVQGDVVELQQVVLNLLMNAADAAQSLEPARRRIRVRSRVERRGDSSWATIAVEDAGVGIGEIDPARLFSPFYTTKPEGLGMGLAICRSIVERHSGRLWATVNEGHGMTFHFSLPALDG